MTLSRRTVLAGAAVTAGGLLIAAPARAATALGGARRVLPGGRSYWLSGSGDRLVVGLPGTGLTASNCNDTFWTAGGWQGHADSAGYVLALAELAASGGWNVGGGWAGGAQDDMAYLAALAADAAAAAGPFVEVFIAGFSAGGAMAWRAAVERPDVFAACGSASGWAPTYPATPVDAWHVHGTGDTTVPIRGGAGTSGFVFPAAALEATRAPRGSRVVLYPTSGGHGTPGWLAGQLWTFWMTDRARP